MDKSYRRLRASSQKRVEADAPSSFFVRMCVCLIVFVILAAMKLRGGDTLVWAENQVNYYLHGASVFSEACTQSAEAFNQFCDRWVEAQDD